MSYDTIFIELSSDKATLLSCILLKNSFTNVSKINCNVCILNKILVVTDKRQRKSTIQKSQTQWKYDYFCVDVCVRVCVECIRK